MSTKLNTLLSSSFLRPARLQCVRFVRTARVDDRIEDPFKSGYSPYLERKMATERSRERLYQNIAKQKAQSEKARLMDRFQTRDWKSGDVYAPHDLSPAEMRKWRARHSPSKDVFDALGINPLHLYKNFSIMSEYVSETGRIKPRSVTGLRPVNQRRLAKAIRRAVGLGLMPTVYRHPEIIVSRGKV